MYTHLRRIVLGSLAALAMAGCGSKFDCSQKGHCPNDTSFSSGLMGTCTVDENGACGGPWSDLAQCFLDHETCDSNGNDNSQLSTLESQCATEVGNLSACCAKNQGAPGCP